MAGVWDIVKSIVRFVSGYFAAFSTRVILLIVDIVSYTILMKSNGCDGRHSCGADERSPAVAGDEPCCAGRAEWGFGADGEADFGWADGGGVAGKRGGDRGGDGDEAGVWGDG